MQTKTKIVYAHLLALLAVFLWGNTFISTKVLLDALNPFEILVFRFFCGYLALLVIHPHIRKPTDIKEELMFFVAGLTGVNLYQLLENVALVHTTASNVGVLVSLAPIFTALLIHFFDKSEKITLTYIIGIAIALIGTVIIMFNGTVMLKLNPYGDFLAIVAAVFWGIYSLFLNKILAKGYHPIYITRKIMFYALVSMIPLMFFMDFKIDLHVLSQKVVLLNILFLGVIASAVGFAIWTVMTQVLGAIKAASYTYAIPIVTIITSVIVLKEKITPLTVIGCVLIIGGVYLADRPTPDKTAPDDSSEALAGGEPNEN